RTGRQSRSTAASTASAAAIPLFPPRRPTIATASRADRSGGTVRPVHAWNTASASVSIGSASSARRNTRQAFHVGPAKLSARSWRSSSASSRRTVTAPPDLLVGAPPLVAPQRLRSRKKWGGTPPNFEAALLQRVRHEKLSLEVAARLDGRRLG